MNFSNASVNINVLSTFNSHSVLYLSIHSLNVQLNGSTTTGFNSL